MDFLRMLFKPFQCYVLLRQLSEFRNADEIFELSDRARALLTGSAERPE